MELSLDMNAGKLTNNYQQDIAGSYRLLYRQHMQAMYNTALRIVNNAAAAETVLKESFIEAFDPVHQYRQRPDTSKWLKQIVVKRSIAAVKKGKQHWADVAVKDIEGYALQDEPDMDEDAFLFTVDGIKQAIRLLPDGYRTVLSLHLLENYSHEDIGGLLDISANTAAIQYKRAKKKLLNIISQTLSHEKPA